MRYRVINLKLKIVKKKFDNDQNGLGTYFKSIIRKFFVI